MPTQTLASAIADRTTSLQPVVDLLSRGYVYPALSRYNSEFAPRYFGRPPSEPIPTLARLLTTFRGRLGSLIEYGLGVTIGEALERDFGDAMKLSIETVNQYPDYYLRGRDFEPLLRIDCKVYHHASDERSARFDLPIAAIQPANDLLMYVAWDWRTLTYRGAAVKYPHLHAAVLVPAICLARERDLRTAKVGGYFDTAGLPRAVPKLPGKPRDKWEVDSNFGKIDRLIHSSRKTADLEESVQAFVAFLSANVPEA